MYFYSSSFTDIPCTQMKDGVIGACLSRNHFRASCPLSIFYFHQNNLKTKHIHTTYWNLPVVLTFSLCNDVTIVRICKRVHAHRSYLFPELLNHRPQTPLCEIQTDLKSVSIPCLSLHLCSCLRSKQGRFCSRFRSCWAFSATHRFIWGSDIGKCFET